MPFYKTAVFFSLMFVSAPSVAWICEEISSRKLDNGIESCGVGLHKSESKSRQIAFEEARKEFRLVCEQSSDCKGREVEVEARRTVCKKKSEMFECRRAVFFKILISEKPVQSKSNVTFNPSSEVFEYVVDFWKEGGGDREAEIKFCSATPVDKYLDRRLNEIRTSYEIKSKKIRELKEKKDYLLVVEKRRSSSLYSNFFRGSVYANTRADCESKKSELRAYIVKHYSE